MESSPRTVHVVSYYPGLTRRPRSAHTEEFYYFPVMREDPCRLLNCDPAASAPAVEYDHHTWELAWGLHSGELWSIPSVLGHLHVVCGARRHQPNSRPRQPRRSQHHCHAPCRRAMQKVWRMGSGFQRDGELCYHPLEGCSHRRYCGGCWILKY